MLTEPNLRAESVIVQSCHSGTPKPNQTLNKLRANFILAKIVQQKTKLETRFIKIIQHSYNILTTGSGQRLGTHYYTANMQDVGNSQNSGMMIQNVHLLSHKGRLSRVTQKIQCLTGRMRMFKDSLEETFAHQKVEELL